MASAAPERQSRKWTRGRYTISTDPSLIPLQTLIRIFSSESFYWGQPMPEDEMRKAVENSLSFGLYKSSSSPSATPRETSTAAPNNDTAEGSEGTVTTDTDLIGIARCVTDFTTFAYLTDVWVDPAEQGAGLGTWLVECINEVIAEMPHLRRVFAFTLDWERSVPFYKKLLGVEPVEYRSDGVGMAALTRLGPGHPDYGKEAQTRV